jgi:hypothetical protein
MKYSNLFFWFFCISLFSFVSCETESVKTDNSARLEFSTDTVFFDTVFTTIGSATKRLKLYNPYNQPIKLSSVKVAGGTSSPYKINVDGSAGTEVNDIRIEAKDSTFIFIRVLIDPTSQNAPILVEDSIVFNLNENVQSVKLLSWGQDIHLLRDSVIKTQTWTADKPYVVADAILVDSFSTLTIDAGVTVFMHRNSWFGVDGKLIVNGTKEKPVVFRGDRLDEVNYGNPMPYDKIPGQWNHIRFNNSSKGNKINYTDIRNAQYGMIVGTLEKEGQAEIELSNCRIYNNSYYSVLGIKSKIKAWNCILANSGESAFMCVQGGEYEFYQCTLVNYRFFGQIDNGSKCAAILMNYAVSDTSPSGSNGKKIYYGDLKKAYFGNCILFGETADEVILSSSKDYAFEYTFDHCLIKGTNDKLNLADVTRFITVKVSDKEEPGFAKIDKTNYIYNFELTRTSLAREIGSLEIAKLYPVDYNGKSRITDENSDVGAFEYYTVTK